VKEKPSLGLETIFNSPSQVPIPFDENGKLKNYLSGRNLTIIVVYSL
jgi:hypothetical protein